MDPSERIKRAKRMYQESARQYEAGPAQTLVEGNPDFDRRPYTDGRQQIKSFQELKGRKWARQRFIGFSIDRHMFTHEEHPGHKVFVDHKGGYAHVAPDGRLVGFGGHKELVDHMNKFETNANVYSDPFGGYH